MSTGREKTRTGLLIVPPLILLIALGPPLVLVLLVLLATFFGLREFFTLALPAARGMERTTAILLGLALSLVITYVETGLVFPFVAFLLLALALLFMITCQDLSSTMANLGTTFLGLFYVGFLLGHISLTRYLADGRSWVLLLVSTVWMGDICAYLSGSFLGKHRLYPKISPKKTYEGLFGAMAGSALTALVFTRVCLPHVGSTPSLLLGIGIGGLGQLGDLTESMLKRSAQVKDSGSLIPGHGGMLDRLDSFLFSAPFLHYSVLFFLKETP